MRVVFVATINVLPKIAILLRKNFQFVQIGWLYTRKNLAFE